jgi:acylphosphatase
MESERIEACFRGRVQGVGFRMTAVDSARAHSVTGYVQNLPDGTVLLVAEGPPGEASSLLRSLRERMGRYIDTVDLRRGEASGEFSRFEIRY